MYDIIIGRSQADRKKYGTNGTILLGKHYVKMGQVTSLSNNIYLDVATSHVVFVCGKRGSGKSYSLGIIAEGISDLPEEIKKNISVVIFDTMGVFWSMEYPNKQDIELLREWNLEPKGLNVEIYTPTGFFKDFKEKGIPTDYPFSIRPCDLDSSDWCTIFDIKTNNPLGVLIERTIDSLKETGSNFMIKDITNWIQKDKKSIQQTRDAVENRFKNALDWGIFTKQATPIKDLIKPGKVTIIDLSCYTTMSDSISIRAMVIGLVSQKLFAERIKARKEEEFQEITKQIHTLETTQKEIRHPLVWLIVDEAHEFLPSEGKTLASDPLITILREGRQPGISLVLASQQPGKIHTDVMTQADTVISHRITAKIDTDALGTLMQSYMRDTLPSHLDNLPRVKGAAIVFDDTNEKIYPMKVRPRFTWHGGSAPKAIEEKKKLFEL